MYDWVSKLGDPPIVAACEDHPETRAQLEKSGKVKLTHHTLDEMLADGNFGIVAIGDYYGRRGALAIRALEAGKHVIADKPLCTTFKELDRIETLAKERGLKVGMMLDLRDGGRFIGVRNLILAGEIGEVRAVSFNGQHPLKLGSRPGWYFEEGKHGGTVNDIAVHAIDLVPWMTGREFARIEAARGWNTLETIPHFQDCAQMMLTMDNGCGVLGDVSYLVPDSLGYSHPIYWRMTFWGSVGVIEVGVNLPEIRMAKRGEKAFCPVPFAAENPGGYFQDFLDDIAGKSKAGGLDTATVLRVSRKTLAIQKAADESAGGISL
jgi:predicted dehydrogenase